MELQSFTRKQLYDLVWKEPIQTLAPRFGLSDRGLAKLYERHAIPTPPRGYWAKKQAGRKVAKVPLFELEGARLKETHAIARFAPPSIPAAPADDAPDPLLAFWQEQRDEIGAIPVTKTLANPHAVIAAWLREDEQQRNQATRWGGASLKLWTLTSLERRRLRILSALYKALEARGVTIECRRGTRIVALRHQRDEVSFDLKEYVQQKRRPLTEAERADHWNADAKYKQDYVETGFLRGKVDMYAPRGVTTMWTESAEDAFESKLGDIAATILAALTQVKLRREAQEEAERKRWEAQQAAWQREEAEKIERAKREVLYGLARNWRAAHDLRTFIAAVSATPNATPPNGYAGDLAAWTQWALKCADALDPLSELGAAPQDSV